MKLFKSRTNQNMAAGNAVSIGTVAAVLAFVRTMWPELLPWPAIHDLAIDAFVGSTLAPLVSRKIAFWRNPEKRDQTEQGDATGTMVSRIAPLLALMLIPALALMPGCMTTPQADGSTVTRVDPDTAMALVQLALTTSESMLALWEDHQDARGDEWQVERDARQARVDDLREQLDRLLALTLEK